MPRFVLLRHECPNDNPRPSHWDLMLEHNGVLWTWALDELLGDVRLSTTALRLANHRIDYLDYEGPLSAGRGSVTRVDRGNYTTDSRDLIRGGQPGSLQLTLDGAKLQGTLQLTENNALYWRLDWSPSS